MRIGLLLLLSFLAMHSQSAGGADSDESRAVRLRLSTPAAVTSPANSSASGNATAAPKAGDTKPTDVSVLGEAPVAGNPPKQRNPQLSEDHLVIIGVNADGAEVARTTIIDPSLIRAESTDSQGRVLSKRLFRESVDFSVILPNDPRIISVQIFRPRWGGSKFELDLVGSGPLR